MERNQITIDSTLKWKTISGIMKYLCVVFIAYTAFIHFTPSNSLEIEKDIMMQSSSWFGMVLFYVFSFIRFIISNLCFCVMLIFIGLRILSRPYFTHPDLKGLSYLLLGFIYIAFKATLFLIITYVIPKTGLNTEFPLLAVFFQSVSPLQMIIDILYYYIVIYFVWGSLYYALFEPQLKMSIRP